jgi:hypothetical protein
MGTVVGSWRLKLILVLIIFMACTYTINGLFMGVNTTSDGYIIPDSQVTYNNTEEGLQSGNDFIGLLTTAFDLMTFGSIDNMYIRIFFNLVMVICSISLVYIIYTFIKEWIPFV